MSVTRGDFLKQLGKSIPGMVLGSGVAVAAQKVIGKMAAASGAMQIAESTGGTAKAGGTSESKIEFIKSGPSGKRQIALTFDDGPTPGVTDRILDELKQRQLHATFFMIGQRIATSPDLARRVLAEGHEVANHTFTHPNLNTLTEAQVEVEIAKTQDMIESTVGRRAVWFRPPYGALRQNQAHLLQKQNLGVILWSVDPADWSQPGEAKITEAILTKSEPGSIIVCHDMHRQTANAIGSILDGLLQRDLRPTTISALLEERA